MKKCFLNIDAGELADEPEELFVLASLANIACGGHVGDHESMTRAVQRCVKHGTMIGAHPSYPDRVGFGRTSMAMSIDALRSSVRSQCEALRDIATTHDAHVLFVKAHGALYHDANRDAAIANAVVLAATQALGDAITVVGPARGELANSARAQGLSYAREAFADRGMNADGSLIARGQRGAMIEDAASAAAQATQLMRDVETLCVHSDTKNALIIARAVKEAIGE